MTEHCSKWLDDPHLSFLIADNLVNAVGDPDVQKIRRHVMDVMDLVDYCNAQTEVIRAGGCAEGFRIRGTDVDIMYVDKLIKVVAETPKNVKMYVAVVRLVLSPDDPPGYVKLAVLTPSAPLQQIQESTKRVSGNYFLSSELYVRWHQRLNPTGVLHGPCVLDRTMHGDYDRAFCLEYKDWPACANEWIERKRQHGWPSQKLVRKIKNIGCHLMAIGSKKLHVYLKEKLQNARRLITPNSFPISNPEEDFKVLKSSRRDEDTVYGEANIDAALVSEIIAKTQASPSVAVLELELKNSLTRETQRNLETLDLDILRLRRFHTLYQLALIYLNISLKKNTTRSRYAYIRKAFCYLHLVRFSDISKGNLTLATAYYCIGRFDSALDYIKEYDEKLGEDRGCIHSPICEGVVWFDQQYPHSFCGQGLSIMEKVSSAASYDFAVYQSMPLIPMEIALEVVMMKTTGSILTIPPELYSGFLKVLCYTNMGNLEMVGIVSVILNDILQRTTKGKQYLAYIMLGVAFVKLGNYEEALRCYCLAHIHKRRLAVSSQNSDRPEWHTRTSVLFYIAQMLRSLIPV
uniref:Uncharacterized protein n=1 Tax=Magallana gigas TaxID=29159 RepID=A0A8W8HS83_MAGGI